MFTIGDFAKHGRVSVRMLRHYDAIGLLRPARVDPHTGYRGYEAGQLAELNRVIALKDLGFTLEQVGAILGDLVGAEELRGMLRLRQAELAALVAETTTRLTRVEARLRTIESEGQMPTNDVVLKQIPAVRVAELSATAASYQPGDITPVISLLFPELCRLVAAAGLTPAGASLAYYVDGPDGTVEVHAALPVAAGVTGAGAGHGFAVVDLPAIESAATAVHHGSMDGVLATEQALVRWIEETGHRATGHSRELYLECEGAPETWVTELQTPVVMR
ncbi:MerR family transcriptional regulator [Kitasatospora sp. MMS16-BH015]|uniref:MerR family transcriptional regulator n=1 Tax=Kitasatospora sp. MMS16-BH015 TaxID=2018025 RepID=UPI000CA0D4B7|nr:MerR family transcriptional regulator [Kitasatospora sp. MMS16-BH015]AUG79542.1 MerR family transcriptional regulator [Kitasatospora sp. MMS16-BH015]